VTSVSHRKLVYQMAKDVPRQIKPFDAIPHHGESVALLVARRTNNQPTIGRFRVRGLLKYHSVDR